MRIPLTKNSIPLYIIAVIVVTLFVSGIFDVLDYAIIKYGLICMTSIIAVIVGFVLFKSSLKQNRPEQNTQDDSSD